MNLSIVIPAYNEEKRIKQTLEKILQFLAIKRRVNNIQQYEIIVVDDGSKDTTKNVVESVQRERKLSPEKLRCIVNEENRGKGFSVKRGFLETHYETILFTDADLSTPIEELEKFLPQLQAADIVIGSRNSEGAKIPIKQPFLRSNLGKIFPKVVNIITGITIKDTQCGFKLFTREAIKKILPNQTVNGFAFDVELLFIAKKLGLRVKELPVTWANAEGSKVNPFKDSIRMLKDVITIRWKDWKGQYV